MSPLLSRKTIALLRYYLDGILIGRLLPNLRIPPVDLTNKTALITGSNSGICYTLDFSLA